jgi:hypothetical protein
MSDGRGSRQLLVILGTMAVFFVVLVVLAQWAADRG